MPENPPEHSHCLECDDPVDLGVEYCSDLCRDKRQEDFRKERNRNYLFFAVVAVILIVLTTSSYFLR